MRLRLIYSGGTIGSAGQPLEPLQAAEFHALWDRHVAPRLGEAELVWHWLDPPLLSSELVPADWGRLARLVLGADEDAVLLLHGTDTMAWTAAALAFLLTLYAADGTPRGRFARPVVLTGAQRPLFEGDGLRPGTDALENLRTALNAAALGRREVIVAFGSLSLRGPRVMKMSTRDDRAFTCPKGSTPAAPLPEATAAALTAQLDRLAPHLGARAVLTVTASPTEAAQLVRQLEAIIDAMDDKLGAIHLLGYGTGNFPARSALTPLLRALHDRGVVLVAGSQVPHGAVDPAAYGAGHWLTDCGALSAADMTGASVHAKLHVGLALAATHGWQRVDMERFFLTPVAGERRT
ncbi:MAG TPA: asparaginase domain-containing protein [Thermohalobaculum sp.]|nr:asparaginase domain-containing protein [Thermohalobaculum sp.]